MRTFYLAHPVTGDDKYTYEQNMAHALKVARIAWDAGLRVDMPWWTICQFLDNNIPEHRDQGIIFDCHMISKHDGLLLLGHKISNGMQIEMQSAAVYNVPVFDLVSVSDEYLPAALSNLNKYLKEQVWKDN